MNSNFKKKAKSGVLSTISVNAILAIARVGIIAILARLLRPHHFGIFATFIVVYEFAKICFVPFVNKNLILFVEDIQVTSAALTISVLHGLVISVTIFLFAPLIGSYFNMPEIINLLRFGTIMIIVMSISNPLTSMMEKNIDFTWLSKIKLVNTLVGTGGVAILFAYLNYGYWALFIGILTTETLNLLFVIIKTPIKLSLFHVKFFKYVYKDSLTISFTGILNKIALKGDYLIVSKFLGGTALGLYSKAYQLMSMPTNLISQAMNKVGFATISQYQNDLNFQKKIFLRLTFLIALLVLPFSGLMYIFSDYVIAILLGSQWIDSLPAFKVLVAGTFFRIAYKIPGTIIQIQREFKKLLAIQSIYAFLIVTGSYLLVTYGILGVATGVLIALCVQYLIMTITVMKILQISLSDLFKAYLVPLIGFVSIISVFYSLKVVLNTNLLSDVYVISVYSLAIIIFIILIIKFKEKILGEYGKWWIKQFKIKNRIR